ncbi:DASH complex subunit DUO1 [Sugiyamaella lignohabitans]|uniref:DASH complex subunit DUO1 n=1 Tax=Sugiyamaella lignohabitans TaxID=796027 RepID=A0A167FK46_9ASCO|nr:DASH complex subunit DUO1 [Sugiyamaella lignohabitans]ANB15402.1 DASH complex subunit DUO1 [Sugiyamaella lignohabitans]
MNTDAIGRNMGDKKQAVTDLANSLESFKTSTTSAKHKTLVGHERQTALNAELDQVRQINGLVQDVLQSVNHTNSNLESALISSTNSNQLLDMWVRILSQTEHTQRLLSNRNWQGQTKDEQLIAERALEKARQEELERQKREQLRQLELENQRREQILAEKRRAKEELLQKRIYGKRAPSVPITSATSAGTGSTRRNASGLTGNSALNQRPTRPNRPTEETNSSSLNSTSRIRPPTGITRSRYIS